jgi:hypothetical protein
MTFKRQLPHREHLSSPPTTNVLKLYRSISPHAQDGAFSRNGMRPAQRCLGFIDFAREHSATGWIKPSFKVMPIS